MDSAPPWQEEPTTSPGRRRWQLLVAAAAIPWLVVIVVLTRGGDTTGAADPASASAVPVDVDPHDHPAADSDPDDRADTDPEEGGPAPHATPAEDAPGVDATSAPATGEAPPPEGWPDPGIAEPRVTDGDAATVAIAVARAWLTDRGAPDLEGPQVAPTEAGYLEHVSVRRIEVLGPELAVVTLGVLLLEREDDRYARVRAADLLVPLALSGDRAHPAGDPWWSAREVDLTPRPPRPEAEASPAELAEVTTALAEAGYRDVQVDHVAHAADGLLVAAVTAETVEGRRLDAEVWLRATGEGPRVLGVEP